MPSNKKLLITMKMYRRGKRFECYIKDHETGKHGTAVDANPALAFRLAEKQLAGHIGYIESADPAEWEPEEPGEWW